MLNRTIKTVLIASLIALITGTSTAQTNSEPFITPEASLIGEFWSNPTGGTSTQNRNLWNTLLDLNLTADLSKIGLPETALLTAQLQWTESRRNLGALETTGSINPSSNIHASDHWRIFNLYYAQSLNHGTFTFKIGQIAADDDFMSSEFSALFLNSSLGAIPSIVAGASPVAAFGDSSACSAYPVAAPGIHANWFISEKLSWQTALYLGAPGPDTHSNHGYKWQTNSNTGLLLFTEFTLNSDLSGNPSTTRIGASLHTGTFTNLQTGNPRSTLFNLYAIQDITLAKHTDGTPSLGAFARIGISPQKNISTIPLYADAGINLFSPLPNRPDDILGLALTATHLSNAYAASESALHNNEYTLELTYQARITKYLSLQADLQYLITPAFNTRSPLILGLRATLSY